MKSILFTLIFALGIQASYAQSDSIRNDKPVTKSFFKKEIVPLSFITVGSLLNIGTIKHSIEDAIPKTNVSV